MAKKSIIQLPPRILVFLCVCLLLFCTVAVIYIGYALSISASGIYLTPSRDIAVIETKYFRQNDPKWAEEKMGGSGAPLSNEGCLVTVIASCAVRMGIECDPAELNAAFIENNVYNETGRVIWHNISKALAGTGYSYSRGFASGTIERELEKGNTPLIRVRYKKTGAEHWVAVVGAQRGEFYIYDPLYDGDSPIPLSQHGRVYAYRVLYKTTNK